MWRLCRNVLPTRENLVKRSMGAPSECVICENSGESILHIFCECVYARKVWDCRAWKVDGYDIPCCDLLGWVWLIWKKNGEAGLLY
jgi:hypothetical protein